MSRSPGSSAAGPALESSPAGRGGAFAPRRSLAALLLAGLCASSGLRAETPQELPVAYRCSGNEPSWSLLVEGPRATFTAMGEAPRELAGTFRSLDYAGLFVFRGAPSRGADWVAFILQRSCEDTMAKETEGGGTMPFAIGLSLPGGDARIGCCRPLEPGPSSAPGPAAGATNTTEDEDRPGESAGSRTETRRQS